MKQENEMELSDKLMELLRRRNEIRIEKLESVKKQNYEMAAKARDKEMRLHTEIFDLIKQENKYDFSKSRQMEADINAILDLVEITDEDFSNAINKLPAMDLERLKLMKDIEKYNLGQITLDQLHGAIKTSFHIVRQDFKKQINVKIEKLE